MLSIHRHLAKTITYRILGTLVTFCTAYIIGGSFTIASIVSISELLIKPVLYFLHERLWWKSDFGLHDDKSYSMFIGRYQPWHDGHKWLIEQRLNEGKNVLICIRDVKTDEKNPYTARQVKHNIESQLKYLGDRIKVIIIPDIESINYGRDVGYQVIEHVPPKEIGKISATKIRNERHLTRN